MAQLLPYLRMLQRGWWIIALTALAAFNIALFNSYNTTPMYRARSHFLVSPSPTFLAGANDDLVRSIEALDKRSIVSTYAEILGSKSVFAETVAALNIDAETLSDYVRTAVVLPDASVLELTIEGPNPEMVALLANQVGDHAINQIKGLYLVYDINFLDVATTPSDPFSPMPVRDSAIALVLGAVVGVLLVFLREILASPLMFFQQSRNTNHDSTAYTSRHMRQLVEQTVNATDVSAFALLKITNLLELKDLLPKPIWPELQRQIVETMRQELRGKDIIGHWDDTAFAFLLPDVAGETAVTALTALHQQFRNPINLPHYIDPIQLHSRIGVATACNHPSLDEISQAAEQALTQAASKMPPIAVTNIQTPIAADGTAN